MNNKYPRVLFVSNSQGTAAGLADGERYGNYPLVIEEQMPGLDCRFWMASDLSVKTICNLYNEIVLQHRPRVLILQSGIIEAALRILPVKLRDLLRVLPGGSKLTKFIHERHGKWLALLSKLNIRFIDVGLEEYINCVKTIQANCVRDKIALVLIEIPPLSEQCENAVLVGNNAVLSKYNDALKKIAGKLNIPIIDPFQGNTDPSRDSLYLPNSVHFTTFGHQIVAENIMAFLSSNSELLL